MTRGGLGPLELYVCINGSIFFVYFFLLLLPSFFINSIKEKYQAVALITIGFLDNIIA